MRCRPELLLVLLAACGAPDDTGETGASTSSETGAVTTSAGTVDAPTTGDAAWASLDERPCPDDSILSSENFGAPLLLTHCTGCHHSSLGADDRAGAPVGVDFDSLDDVRSRADRIWARAADHNTDMPPAGGPAADERAQLGEWLACGAPTAAEL